MCDLSVHASRYREEVSPNNPCPYIQTNECLASGQLKVYVWIVSSPPYSCAHMYIRGIFGLVIIPNNCEEISF